MAEESRMRGLTQAYLACTSAMDDCLGGVIDALDRSAMAENTWIVVLSDHGWHLGEKQHIAKQTLWERSTRVPLIIVPPKRIADTPRGARCERPVDLLDVYPTLLAATGVKPAESDKLLEGLSLMPWISDPDAPRERPALTTLYSGNHALRDERYRYIRYADGSEELYDHSDDPHEHRNLISKTKEDPELHAAVERLAAWIPEEQAGKPDLVLPENGK
jgi:arylsulfatase A-like enzyme